MLDITPWIVNHLPHKHKKTPTGWYHFNAVCCHHRGHKPDTRARGNLKSDATGISYSCFNCGFKTRHTGDNLSTSFEQFMTWLGMSQDEIQKIKLGLLKQNLEEGTHKSHVNHMVPQTDWGTVTLPKHSAKITDWLESGCDDPHLIQVCEYLQSRGEHIAQAYDWWWSPESDHDWRNRLLIPMWKGDQMVAYTGRYAGAPPPQVPKYLNSPLPPGYLFNWDHMWGNRKFVIVCEGPMDAIAVQGVASMGSTLTEQQIYHLCESDKQVVVLPDRTKSNQHMIDVALSFGWAVSFPDWEAHIKDAADACKAYGDIYTITSALAARTTNPLTIGVKRKWMPG